MSTKEFEFKVNNFDLIRLVAALQVVIVHGYEHLGITQWKAVIDFISIFPGVPIFFVISGFLISASFERGGSLSTYYQNRLLRIYPALWGCLLVAIVSVLIVFSLQTTIKDFSIWFLAQISIAQFYNPPFLREYGVGVLNGSLWTIPVEIQFYFVLPIIYYLMRKINWNSFVIVIVFICLVLLNQIYINVKSGSESIMVKVIGVSVLPYLYMFMLGILLKKNLLFVKKFLSNKVVYWVVLHFVMVGFSAKYDINYSGNYLNPLCALTVGLMTISLAYSFTSRLSNLLNGYDISYGVYIYHMIFVNVLVELEVFSPQTNIVIMMSLTILFAIFSWVIIEKPSLSLKRKTLKIR